MVEVGEDGEIRKNVKKGGRFGRLFEWDLYGTWIALLGQSFDPSLSTRLNVPKSVTRFSMCHEQLVVIGWDRVALLLDSDGNL